MDDGSESTQDDELHALFEVHFTDLDGVEPHPLRDGPRRRTLARISISLFATSTMCRTRSSVDIRNCARILPTSTPRASSFGFFHSSTIRVYAVGVTSV